MNFFLPAFYCAVIVYFCWPIILAILAVTVLPVVWAFGYVFGSILMYCDKVKRKNDKARQDSYEEGLKFGIELREAILSVGRVLLQRLKPSGRSQKSSIS